MRARPIAAIVIAALCLGGTSIAAAHQTVRAVRTGAPPTASGSQTVSFTVSPVILVVVDSHGRARAVWTNLRSAPSAGVRVVARLGNRYGPGRPVTAADRVVLSQVHWGNPGLAWTAP